MTFTKKLLNESQPGTDLHGLIEKTAYYLYDKLGNSDKEKNWNLAKEIIFESEYLPCQNNDWHRTLNEHLKIEAYYLSILGSLILKTSDQLQYWISAQTIFAENIVEEYISKTKCS